MTKKEQRRIQKARNKKMKSFYKEEVPTLPKRVQKVVKSNGYADQQIWT